MEHIVKSLTYIWSDEWIKNENVSHIKIISHELPFILTLGNTVRSLLLRRHLAYGWFRRVASISATILPGLQNKPR